jgi:hypothetical protein
LFPPTGKDPPLLPSWGKEPVPTLESQSNLEAHTASSDGNNKTSLYIVMMMMSLNQIMAKGVKKSIHHTNWPLNHYKMNKKNIYTNPGIDNKTKQNKYDFHVF